MALTGWLPLLRAVYQGHVQNHHLQPITVARILKKVAARVDLEEEKRRKVRGHSLRVGGAAGALALPAVNGVSLPPGV